MHNEQNSRLTTLVNSYTIEAAKAFIQINENILFSKYYFHTINSKNREEKKKLPLLR